MCLCARARVRALVGMGGEARKMVKLLEKAACTLTWDFSVSQTVRYAYCFRQIQSLLSVTVAQTGVGFLLPGGCAASAGTLFTGKDISFRVWAVLVSNFVF